MFVGNVKAVNLLDKAVANGKISQAYLFSGPEGVGKFTLAKIFSGSLIGGSKRGSFSDFEVAENFPDLLVVRPEIEEKRGIVKEKNISVEQIRKAQKDLSLFPYSGEYKVLIIDDAQKMNIFSQNALLKILEEPNGTSIIILVTQDDSKILATLKSRCQRINFTLAEEEDMEKMANKENIREAVVFSMGRPGFFFRMIENKEVFESRKEYFEIFRKFQKMGINEKFALAEKISKNSKKLVEILEFWIWIIRTEVLKNYSKEGFFSFETVKKIEKTTDKVKNTNINARLAIESLFLEI
jgi:DNA polymerase-3 subunit delta'